MNFKQKKISIVFGDKKFDVLVDLVPKWFEGIGLMFKGRDYRRRLLFSFKRPTKLSIHSLFCFYPFYAIWMDEKMRVLSVKKVLPFSFSVGIKEKYRYLLEVPINKFNLEICNFIDENFDFD